MKKFLLIIIVILLSGWVYGDTVIDVVMYPYGETPTEKTGPSQKFYPEKIPCKAMLLIDPDNDKIIYSKKDKYPFPNASTTKLMTALLACDYLKPYDYLTVSERAAKIPFNSMGFKEGEHISFEDCLAAMLIRSANDSAVVIAENVAGSEEYFAELMNKKAYNLGCLNTFFVTASGLHHQKHHTTCHDLAIIAKEAVKNPLIKNLINTKSYEITTRENSKGIKTVKSENNYILKYPYCEGAKSGYTSYAGQCMVCFAGKGDKHLLLVVLGVTGGIQKYLPKIMDWGFENAS
ncbi:MAG: D-alanyl-D-alanine carboxypeptidase [Abditibacteriota bacterium]|nr:D-alanyl-D-alanine carboxypeptidase [Abditibacteriota bacterium]